MRYCEILGYISGSLFIYQRRIFYRLFSFWVLVMHAYLGVQVVQESVFSALGLGHSLGLGRRQTTMMYTMLGA